MSVDFANMRTLGHIFKRLGRICNFEGINAAASGDGPGNTGMGAERAVSLSWLCH